MYYNLEEYEESMNYALGAGKLFDLTEKSEFVDKIVLSWKRQFVIWVNNNLILWVKITVSA